MLNKQIFEIETGKLLVKNLSEKWVGLGGYDFFFTVAVFGVFFLVFGFVVAVVAVVFVCLFFLVGFSF